MAGAVVRHAALVGGGLIFTYTVGYLLWYSGTPLGLWPVLDDREMLALAHQIAAGELPHEAFYRAPGYAAVLAVGLKLGITPAELPFAARLFNGACHLLSTALAWRLAARIWSHPLAGFITGALIGFNPVLLHFSGDALDITLALCLMLAGVAATLEAAGPGTRSPWHPLARASLWFALGALTRPQLLPLLAVPALLAWRAPSGRSRRLAYAGAALGPAGAVLLTFGALNAAVGDDFRLLPWQGAYNLWAANKPGAHGRYFEQSIPIRTGDEAANTARMESEILYRRAHSAADPADYRAASAYWRERTLAHIRAAPLAWLRLLVSKAYFLLNNVEQYNNKTYGFHKARSPWLKPNPLGWSAVLIPGLAGFVLGWRQRAVRYLAACAGIYAAGTLLYFVSDRFRVPLVPLFAVAAGGLVELRPARIAARLRTVVLAAALAVSVGAISLIPMPSRETTKTHVQDYLALARASSELGAHAAALRYARLAAGIDPDRPAVQDLLCIAGFNVWIHTEDAPAQNETWRAWQAICAPAARYSDVAQRILGYAELRLGKRDEALARWYALVDRASAERDDALAALVLARALRPKDHARLRALPQSRASTVVLLAEALAGDDGARRILAARMSATELQAEMQPLRRLFNRP